jgi:nucleoid DNA-binding protein
MVASETKKAVLLTIPGIGKRIIAKRRARMGRNLGKGEGIKIPA